MNDDTATFARLHETAMPAGVFPDLETTPLPERFDPTRQCMLCFGPLGFTLLPGSNAGADVCPHCSVSLTRAERVTVTHLLRYIATLLIRYNIPLPAVGMRPQRPTGR